MQVHLTDIEFALFAAWAGRRVTARSVPNEPGRSSRSALRASCRRSSSRAGAVGRARPPPRTPAEPLCPVGMTAGGQAAASRSTRHLNLAPAAHVVTWGVDDGDSPRCGRPRSTRSDTPAGRSQRRMRTESVRLSRSIRRSSFGSPLVSKPWGGSSPKQRTCLPGGAPPYWGFSCPPEP